MAPYARVAVFRPRRDRERRHRGWPSRCDGSRFLARSRCPTSSRGVCICACDGEQWKRRDHLFRGEDAQDAQKRALALKGGERRGPSLALCGLRARAREPRLRERALSGRMPWGSCPPAARASHLRGARGKTASPKADRGTDRVRAADARGGGAALAQLRRRRARTSGGTRTTRLRSVAHDSMISFGPLCASTTTGAPKSIASHKAQPPSSLRPVKTTAPAARTSSK